MFNLVTNAFEIMLLMTTKIENTIQRAFVSFSVWSKIATMIRYVYIPPLYQVIYMQNNHLYFADKSKDLGYYVLLKFLWHSSYGWSIFGIFC